MEQSIGVNGSRPMRRSLWIEFWARLFREKPMAILGGVIVLLLLFCGIFANYLAPYGMNQVNLEARLQSPSPAHLLGTDQLGRDTLSRIIYGARVSVIIGLSASLINVVLAAIIGTFTGFFGGTFDMIVQRLVDAWMAFPSLLILITVMSLAGRGYVQIILVLGISSGIGSSRVVRSAVMGIRENLYVSAAKSIGGRTSSILMKHILPNITAPLIIIFSISIGSVIITEASLSFLGFGLPPDVASWGGMLSNEGRIYMELAPRLALWPGLALAVVVYGVNIFGDAVRDLLDPRLRGGVGGMGERGIALAKRALGKRVRQGSDFLANDK